MQKVLEDLSVLEKKLLSLIGRRKKTFSRCNFIRFQKNDIVELPLSSCVDSYMLFEKFLNKKFVYRKNAYHTIFIEGKSYDKHFLSKKKKKNGGQLDLD